MAKIDDVIDTLKSKIDFHEEQNFGRPVALAVDVLALAEEVKRLSDAAIAAAESDYRDATKGTPLWEGALGGPIADASERPIKGVPTDAELAKAVGEPPLSSLIERTRAHVEAHPPFAGEKAEGGDQPTRRIGYWKSMAIGWENRAKRYERMYEAAAKQRDQLQATVDDARKVLSR